MSVSSFVSPFKFSFLVLAFLRFENPFLMFCYCLLIIFFLSVCLFVFMYPIVCLCSVITRSYFSSLIKQLCIMIVCSFAKLSLEVRFKMMDAMFGLMISNVLNC